MEFYGYSRDSRPLKFFEDVNKLNNIKLHALDADVAHLFPKNCEYIKAKLNRYSENYSV